MDESRETDTLYLYLCIHVLSASVPRSHYWLQSLLLPPQFHALASSKSRASKHGAEVLLSQDGTEAGLCLCISFSRTPLCTRNEWSAHITMLRFKTLLPRHEEMCFVSQHKLLVNLAKLYKALWQSNIKKHTVFQFLLSHFHHISIRSTGSWNTQHTVCLQLSFNQQLGLCQISC